MQLSIGDPAMGGIIGGWMPPRWDSLTRGKSWLGSSIFLSRSSLFTSKWRKQGERASEEEGGGRPRLWGKWPMGTFNWTFWIFQRPSFSSSSSLARLLLRSSSTGTRVIPPTPCVGPQTVRFGLFIDFNCFDCLDISPPPPLPLRISTNHNFSLS